jgi:hypothetical protein
LEPVKGQFLLYQTEAGNVNLDVRLEDETVRLTQPLMAELFQTTQQNISQHVQNIYDEGELIRDATHKKFLSVRREGKRDVRRELEYYNLDMIISVGYRVKSAIATRFRIRAAHGQTAAGAIFSRVDVSQPNIGGTNWVGSRIRKSEVEIAKNFLNAEALDLLNRRMGGS